MIDDAAVVDTSKPAAAVAKLSVEQYLDYIKKQKLKIKTLERDILLLKDKSSSSSLTTSKATAGVGSGANPCSLKDISVTKLSPFLLKLLICSFKHANNVCSKYSKPCSGVSKLWNTWKYNTLKHRLYEQEKLLQSSTKVIASLEQKNNKLKALLARTHQANQRNAEDSTAMKKAQIEAIEELKSIKRREEAERSSLMETLRAQSIETAFHNDFELSIQKAAEEILLQNRKSMDDAAATSLMNSSSVAVMNDATYDSASTNATPTKLSGPTNGGSQCTQLELDEYMVEIEKLQRENVSLTSIIDKNCFTIAAKDEEINQLRRIYDEENSLRHDLEVELQITLANRSNIIDEISVQAEVNANKRLISLQEELSSCTIRIDSLQLSVKTLTDQAVAANNEMAALYANNKKLAGECVEVEKLRHAVSELKLHRLKNHRMNSGNSSSSSTSSSSSSSSSSEGTKSDNHELLALCYEVVHSYIKQSQCVTQLQEQICRYREEVPYVWCIASQLIAVMQEHLLDYIDSKASNASLRHVLQAIDDEISIVNSVTSSISSSSSSAMLPMLWEAASVTISAGRDISIPVIVSTGATHTIEWKFSGEGCDHLSVLCCVGSKETSLASSSMSPDRAYSGTYTLNTLDVASGCVVVKLKNTSLWVQCIVAYSIQLKSSIESAAVATAASDTDHQLHRLLQNKRSIEDRIAMGASLYNQFTSLSRAALTTNKSSLLNRVRVGSTGTGGSKSTDVGIAYLNKLDKLSIGNSKYVPSTVVGTTSSGNSSSGNGSSGNGNAVTLCSSLRIKASDEYRMELLSDFTAASFRLSYHIQFPYANRLKKGIDIGFAIVEQAVDGSFPQLLPYRRVSIAGESGSVNISRNATGSNTNIFLLFDNTYSYFKHKEVKYTVSITPIAAVASDSYVIDGGTTRIANSSSSSGDADSENIAVVDGTTTDAANAAVSDYDDGIADKLSHLSKEIIVYLNKM